MKKDLYLFFVLGIIFIGATLFFYYSQANISNFLKRAQIIEEKLKEKPSQDEKNLEVLKGLEKIEVSFDEFNSSLKEFKELFSQIEKIQDEKGAQIKETLLKIEKELENLKERNKEIEGSVSFLAKEISDLKDKLKETDNYKVIEEKKEGEEIQGGSLSGLIISEVCAGFDSAQNEFIEIYNPNDFPVKISDENFVLELVDSKNEKSKKKIDWKRDIIPSKGYFLFVGGDIKSENQRIEGDAYYSSQLSSISGVIIKRKDGKILDRVGWGEEEKEIPLYAVEFKAKLKEGGLKTGEGLQRKIKNSRFIDTDKNLNDFDFSLILTPQNSLGEKIVYSKFQADSSQKIVEEKTSIPGAEGKKEEKLLITEVGIEGDEYIKIFNPNDFSLSLNGKYLVYYSSKRTIEDPYRLWEIKESIFVAPKNSVLIAIYLKENSNLKPDWQVLTKENKPYSKGQISSNGAIGIFDCDPKQGLNCKLDLVGWGKTNVFEGEPFNFTGKGKVITRKIQNSSYQDTDNNLNDFEEK